MRINQRMCECGCGQATSLAKNTDYRHGTIKGQPLKFVGCHQLKKALTKHGGCKTPVYKIWSKMRARCLNPTDAAWRMYGGRGITICDRWKDFTKFAKDMGPRPSDDHSLDRKNNNGNYEPSNCRWSTQKQQCNNKRNNVWITHKGMTMTLTQWAEHLGVPIWLLANRRKRGELNPEQLFRPARVWPAVVPFDGIKLCECGCGTPTPISRYSSKAEGCVRGQPRRFIQAHNFRSKRLTA